MFISVLDRLISSWPYVSAKSDRQPKTPSPPPRLFRSTVSLFVFSPPFCRRIFKHAGCYRNINHVEHMTTVILQIKDLCFMETVHKHFPVVKDRPTIIQPRVDNVFSVDLRNPNRMVN
jgi:hypothetical protein